MTIGNAKEENVYINILKIIFSLFILTTHCAVLLHFDTFPVTIDTIFGSFSTNCEFFLGGAIFVDWFYIFTGFMLAKTIVKLEGKVPVFETSSKIIFKKMSSIFPYYFMSCMAALFVYLKFKYITIGDTWTIYQVGHEILMLQMTALPIVSLTGTSWYLSSLWIALIILVPIMVIAKKKFIYFFAVIIALLLFIYIFLLTGHLYGPVEWLDLGYKGNLRAIADICIGCFSFSISKVLYRFIDKFKISTFIFSILVNIAIIIYAIFVENSIWYFIFPFIYALILPMSMHNFLYNNSVITNFIGKLSMAIFMNHYYIANIIDFLNIPYSREQRYLICIISSLCISIFVLLTGDFLRFIYRKIVR